MTSKATVPAYKDTQKSILDWPALVWMVWDSYELTDGYLCQQARLLASGWVEIVADGYLWREDHDAGQNEREMFDRPMRMAIPPHRVRFIEWRDDSGASSTKDGRA